MNKQKIYEFDPQIYPRKLWVTVGVPFDELKDEFENLKPMEESNYAQVDHIRKLKPEVRGGLLVRFEDLEALKKAGNITHETTHVATEIYDYIGAYHDNKNQEPFAYLCGWIAACIEEVKQIEIENKKEANNDNTGTQREEAQT